MDVILVIFQLVVVQAAANQYYESNSTSTWEDANRRCNLATPHIDVASDGYSVHIDSNLKHGAVWIGYFKMVTVFEYIECAVIDSQHHSQTINLTRQYNSPGLCYTACKEKEIIGVSLDKCICLSSVQSHHLEFQCNMSCNTESESFLCGGKDHMSIYKVNKNETAGIGNRQCLSFERVGSGQNIFTWRDCNNYTPILCENETIGVSVVQNYHTWNKAVQMCFQNGLQPISYQALRQTQLTVSPSWSGIISSDVIYTSKEWRSSFTGVRFGYMRANKTVDFTEKNDRMSALCNRSVTEQRSTSTLLPSSRADNTTSVTAVSTSVSSVTDATVATTSSTAGISTASTRFSSVRTTSGQAADRDVASDKGENKQSRDVGIIVGVTVAAVLLVTALIGVIVFLRRRRHIPDLRIKLETTKKAENTNQSVPTYANVFMPPSDEISDSNYVHTYSALAPQDTVSQTYDILAHASGH